MDRNIFGQILENKKDCTDSALYDSDGKTMTYKALYNSAVGFGKRISCVQENNIIIAVDNSLETVIALFGIWWANKTAVILANISRIDIEQVGRLCHTNIVVDGNNLTMKRINRDESKVAQLDTYEEKIYNSNISVILPTSGSISNPRFVKITNQNIITAIVSIKKIVRLDKLTHEMIVFPLSSVSALISQLLAVLYCGGKITLYHGRFIPEKIFKILEEKKISITGLTPSSLNICLDTIQLDEYDLDLTIFIGGEKAASYIIEKLNKKHKNIRVIQLYGMTETAGMITGGICQEYPIDSVGHIFEGSELRILDSNRNLAKTREVGEIWIRGSQVCQGYLNNDKLNRELFFQDGILTGDLGYLDENDYLYIVGRKKNVINIAGKKVYPEEVEECILAMKGIRNVSVYGTLNQHNFVEVIANVTLSDESAITVKDIYLHCKSKLDNYKIPKKINIMQSENLIGMGKQKRG